MFGLGLIPILEGPFHLLIAVVFDILILTMLIWMLASWFVAMMPQAGGGRFIHFLESIIAPVIDPVRKRIPSTSMGMINIGYTVAFMFVWWSLQVLAYVILQGLPRGW